jgi:hypothetical protein
MNTRNERYKIAWTILVLVLCFEIPSNAQQTLLFGTITADGKTSQGRFEVVREGTIKSILYAPYGITPVIFQNVSEKANQLAFTWPKGSCSYKCVLAAKSPALYQGTCICDTAAPIEILIREFTVEDAILQGDTLRASTKELHILDRALTLLNNGSNWNRLDNRVCDNPSYPYQWSLFCSLHQASIDLDGEYRHLRPAVQATRQAINEITSGKKYAHLLRDYNNEAQNFEAISKALQRAREIILEKIRMRE